MRREIAAVVFFLKRLVKTGAQLDSHQVELFVDRLAVALQEKFKGHWYPADPSKGHAYRCIRINSFHRPEPELLRACWESGLQYSDLGLPGELTLWVDPGEVCCRYAEQTPFFSVATFPSDEEEDKDVAKKGTSALERVSSDYHSGSSSDEESTRTSPLTFDDSRSSQGINPNAPPWHPKQMGTGTSVIVLHQGLAPCSIPPHTSWQKLWVPPSYRTGPGYWDANLAQPYMWE